MADLPDRGQIAIDMMPSRFRNKSKVQRLLRALCDPMQDVEQALSDLAVKRAVDTAEGEQLRVIARLVGQPVLDLEEELFRSVIKARITANRSSGLGGEILKIARLVFGLRAAEVGATMLLRAKNTGQASYGLKVEGLDLPWELAELLMTQFLRNVATATGVRAVLEFSPFQTPTTDNYTRAFRFAGGSGAAREGFGSLDMLKTDGMAIGTTGSDWNAVLYRGTDPSAVSMSVFVITGAGAAAIVVNDDQIFNPSGPSWDPAPGNVGIAISATAIAPTVAAVEAKINTDSSLLRVAGFDPTPTKVFDTDLNVSGSLVSSAIGSFLTSAME